MLSRKEQILSIPHGEPRPHHTTVLGKAIMSYCGRNGGSYDAAFKARLVEKHPLWFPRERKRALLNLPPGSPKPLRDTLLGKALRSYTVSSQIITYDAECHKTLMARHPDWFKVDRKKQLLSLPLNSPRPQTDTTLYWAIRRYTALKSPSYDAAFAKKLAERFPAWTLPVPVEVITSRSAERRAMMKEKLLKIPVGEKRPPVTDSLGVSLALYVGKGKYSDPGFSKTMKAKHPSWFKDAAGRKAAFLSLPVGVPRPSGHTLTNYLSPTSSGYDAEFRAAIRKRQPQWFASWSND